MELPLDVVMGMIEGIKKFEVRRKNRVMTKEAKLKAAKIRAYLGA